MSLIIAFDPGLQGAICLLEDGKIKELHTMPIFEIELTTKLKSGKLKKRKYVDSEGIKKVIKWHQDAQYFIEQVRSLHGMSAQSNFSMGHGLGVVEGCVRMIADHYFLIKPQEWQKKVWIESDYVYNIVYNGTKKKKTRDTKATSLNAAQRIFPDETFLKSKRSSVPHDGMVDAALIAWSQYIGEQ